ncbi:hypothetical protein GCM10027277_33270 [Pseudoduganella ginsengisoli]
MKELLLPYTKSSDTEKKMVALALIGNYNETRQIAALWSSLYWGFTWAAAVLGALSGLILKLESFLSDDKIRKDIAALFTVTAAIMITVSTGGDFQRKWRTNRAAAAQIEQLGYDFASKNGDQAGTYLTKLSSILMQRHLSIIGMPEEGEVRQRAASSPMIQRQGGN